MAEGAVKLTRNLKNPELPGIYFRMLCMTGKNKGISYYLRANRLVMGRGDTADIQVLDTKSSREHAELTKHGDSYVLTDLGSQNGVVVNDLKVNQHTLRDGDKIIIGQTVFKYNKLEISNVNAVTKVEDENDENDEDDEELEDDEKEGKKKKALDDPKKKKKLYIYGALLFLLVLFLPDDGAKKETTRKGPKSQVESGSVDDLEGLIRQQEAEQSKEVRDKINEYIHRGRREYREGNYFRCIEEFNLALILSPNDGRSSFYLNKCKQALDNHIKQMNQKGAQQAEQLKFAGALKAYCEVIKLLQDYPEDLRYKEAEGQIEVLEQKIGKEKGEYKCWE